MAIIFGTSDPWWNSHLMLSCRTQFVDTADILIRCSEHNCWTDAESPTGCIYCSVRKFRCHQELLSQAWCPNIMYHAAMMFPITRQLIQALLEVISKRTWQSWISADWCPERRFYLTCHDTTCIMLDLPCATWHHCQICSPGEVTSDAAAACVWRSACHRRLWRYTAHRCESLKIQTLHSSRHARWHHICVLAHAVVFVTNDAGSCFPCTWKLCTQACVQIEAPQLCSLRAWSIDVCSSERNRQG